MFQTPVPGTRIVKNLSVRWVFLLVLDLPAGRQVLCFEFVSDFVLRISDLLGAITFINSETLHYFAAGAVAGAVAGTGATGAAGLAGLGFVGPAGGVAGVAGAAGLLAGITMDGAVVVAAPACGYSPTATADGVHFSRKALALMVSPGLTPRGFVYAALFTSGSVPSVV